ncbi:MAG: methylenetetrahydrofolate--tRNA-(uracil(54)-C(5))-methyltransferase (FADH(2)-oxidizing) TrmFO [Deltaproteobacteria bacterium]|nr:methylenetetrahydrofolate--tRNA-(uracil(54)-C(5))-methyltransferase (FADH(2)-oxidizing) TrmFO [Deltaproteobacteria bacterium]
MADANAASNARPVVVIGAGLAGAEAAWQCAAAGLPVRLYEMRPGSNTPAHRTPHFAELVCSNSLRSDEPISAVGCLKEEMRELGSLIIRSADAARVPAGKALAVDRDGFSRMVTDRVSGHPLITVAREEVMSLARLVAEPIRAVIVATGPLTADPLARELLARTQTNALYFYDSLAPLVAAETIDMTRVFRASRYGVSVHCGSVPGGGIGDDYINCPMDEPLYTQFLAEVLRAEKVPVHDFEDAKFFEGCLPIEVMAERGPGTLRHGPMKPMGLRDPRTGREPYAVAQLRQDNAADTVYNMVGFQTRMKWPEQERIFRMIPGLAQAEFLRLGAMHRNTYLNSPLLLDERLRLKGEAGAVPIHFTGQITGVEGYVESAAMGLWVSLTITRDCTPPPQTTALGALIHHVAHGNPQKFEPQNAHWGLTPRLEMSGNSRDRKEGFMRRARADFAKWLEGHSDNIPTLACKSNLDRPTT